MDRYEQPKRDTGEDPHSVVTVQSHVDTRTPTKVTLTTMTNWKRLANVPGSVNINGLVQGVHWCEYIVFLDDKNVLYLYHLKWGIWSLLNSMDLCTAAKGCPLAVFKNELIIVPNGGSCICKFSMDAGRWMQHEKLSAQFSCGGGLEVTLNNVILAATSDQQLLFLLFHQTTNRQSWLYLRQYHNSKWSLAKQLQSTAVLGTNEFQISYAIVQTDLYVCTSNNNVYIVHTQQNAGEKVMVTNIHLPLSLTMSTICGVNNTLFSFGGKDRDNQPSSDVSRYNPATKEWESAGYMRSCRFSTMVTPFLRDSKDNLDVFVVGGYLGGTTCPYTLLTCRITESCEVGASYK